MLGKCDASRKEYLQENNPFEDILLYISQDTKKQKGHLGKIMNTSFLPLKFFQRYALALRLHLGIN